MSTNEVREQIILAMAHTFFIHALSSEIESNSSGDQATNHGKLGRPMSGESWESIYPDNLRPRSAVDLAMRCAAWIEEKSGVGLETSYARCLLRNISPREPAGADSFGHALAMEIMGTGVAWADSHDEHDLELPNIEVCLDLVRDVVTRIVQKDGEEEFSLVTQARFHLSWSSRDVKYW